MSLRGSRSSLSSRHTGSENQSKFIQDRVAGAERHLGELCQEIGAYARKTAHLRDKGDEIAATLFAYAESEHYNQTLREASVQFAEGLAAVQDYRQAEIDRLEAKVLQPFAQFGGTVKHIKDDLKRTLQAHDREQSRQQQLERVKERHPSDRHQISHAETELMRASVDASRSGKALEEQLDQFERKKIALLKESLTQFVKVELLFHARALELYSAMHGSVAAINEEDDIEELHNSLRLTHVSDRLDAVQANSASVSTAGGGLGHASSRGSLAKSSASTSKNSLASSRRTPTLPRGERSSLRRQRNPDQMNGDGGDAEHPSDDSEDEDDDDEDEEAAVTAATKRRTASRRK